MRRRGTCRRQASSDSCTWARPSPNRRSTTSGSDSSPVSEGTTSTRSSQRSRAASSSAKLTREPSISPGRENSTCVFALPCGSSSTNWLAPSPRTAAGWRERPCVQRVAEREVVLLDRDDVGEIGADVERELEAKRRRSLVPDDEVVLHAVADEALAGDRERVLHEPVRDGVAEVEGGREVLDRARGEQQRPGPVDAELEPGEEARVLGEEAAASGRRGRRSRRRCRTSTPRESSSPTGRRHSSRRMRAPLDCASAVTTISSTFTFAGRVNAKSTHSATSSGRTGPPSATSA